MSSLIAAVSKWLPAPWNPEAELTTEFVVALNAIDDVNADLRACPGFDASVTQTVLHSNPTTKVQDIVRQHQSTVEAIALTRVEQKARELIADRLFTRNKALDRDVEIIVPGNVAIRCRSGDVNGNPSFILAPSGRYVLVAPHYFFSAVRNPQVTLNARPIPYKVTNNTVRERSSSPSSMAVDGVDYEAQGFRKLSGLFSSTFTPPVETSEQFRIASAIIEVVNKKLNPEVDDRGVGGGECD